MRGYFITFEGPDGSGKTTISTIVAQKLKEMGYDAIYTREPGGSKIAEEIRNILLSDENENMDPRTEALLFAASRRQHLVDIVLPALQEKKIVLCDRFVDSSLAYQGYAREIGIPEIWDINQFAIHDCMPQKTIFLKVSMETGQKRMNQRGEKNRLDNEQSDFHQKVRQGYETLIQMYPDRICVIDAEPEPEVVLQSALHEVLKVIQSYE